MDSKVALFILLVLVGNSAGQLSFDFDTKAGTESSKTISSSDIFGRAFADQSPFINVTTTSDATLNIVIEPITAAASLLGNYLFAGGASTDNNQGIFVGFSANAFTTLQGLAASISLTVKSNVQTTITLKLATGKFAVSADGTTNIQTALFLGTNDVYTASRTLVLTYGAVAYSIGSNNVYTYTFPVNSGSTTLYFKAIDLFKAKNSNGNGGSSSFNAAGSFIPVSYNTNFNLQSGYQYAYGNNIRVTPTSTAAIGTASGDLLVNYVGDLSTKSKGPNSASYSLDASYYFNSKSSATNTIQYVSTTATNFRVNGNATASASVDTVGSAKGSVLTWYRATGDASTSIAGNAWTKVSSTSNYVSGSNGNSGSVSVYAQVSQYSQWTIGTNDGAAAGLQITIATFVVAALLAVAF